MTEGNDFDDFFDEVETEVEAPKLTEQLDSDIEVVSVKETFKENGVIVEKPITYTKEESQDVKAIPSVESVTHDSNGAIPNIERGIEESTDAVNKSTGSTNRKGTKSNGKGSSKGNTAGHKGEEAIAVDTTKLEKEISSLKAQVEDLKQQNKLMIDLQNSDDKKKITELLSEGKILLTPTSRAFILAEQKMPPYDPSSPVIHRIICDEIVHVNIRKYYMDLTIMPKGKRTLIREDLWVHHKGYSTYDTITQEQLDYLIDKNFIEPKQLLRTYIDASTGQSIFMGPISVEPELEDVLKAVGNEEKLYSPKAKKAKIVEESTLVQEEVNEESELDDMEI